MTNADHWEELFARRGAISLKRDQPGNRHDDRFWKRGAQALFLRDGSARVVFGSATGEQTTSGLFGGSLMVTRGAGQI